MVDDCTTQYEIHPAVGIARLGVSDEFFLGPEPAGEDTAPLNSRNFCKGRPCEPRARDDLNSLCDLKNYRDSSQRLKRQAARFRVYKVTRDSCGMVTDAHPAERLDVQVTWSIQLANTKAAADKFRIPHQRRNERVPRKCLRIDTGRRRIGKWLSGKAPQVLEGTLGPCYNVNIVDQRRNEIVRNLDKSVSLGEAYVDDRKRLVLIGPEADTGWFWDAKDDCYPEWYFFEGYNNDGWYDNTSDGPIYAEITAQGCDPVTVTAWAVVAPFNFAPDIDPFVTAYDVMYEQACERRFPGFPFIHESSRRVDVDTSFEDDVLPLLEKSRQIRWLNGWSMQAETQDRHFWWNRSPTDDRFEGISKPRDHSSQKATIEGEAWRKALFAHMRDPWVSVSLDLDKSETASLSAVLEWLEDYIDGECTGGPAVADMFKQRQHDSDDGIETLIRADSIALDPLVTLAKASSVSDWRGQFVSIDALLRALKVVAKKTADLRKEFSCYRPLIMPRQVGNDYGVMSEYDWATRFAPDPFPIVDATDRMLALTKVQHTHLKNWSEGNFIECRRRVENPLDSPTCEHFCEALTRIALEACNGGALYPGIEVTRIIRNQHIYSAPFRITVGVWDDVTETCTGGVCAGDLTKSLAVPWQDDFFQCNMEISSAWWPASRPDDVFMHVPIVEVDSQPEEMRSWTGQVLDENATEWRDDLLNRTHRFICHWHKLAVVVKKEIPPGISLVRPPAPKDAERKPERYITHENEIHEALKDLEDWTRWWHQSGCPAVEIQYFDELYKRDKRYLISLRGTGPAPDDPDHHTDHRPFFGYILDNTVLDEWERTRRPDIEYYDDDHGKHWKRYFVHVADVPDNRPRKTATQG